MGCGASSTPKTTTVWACAHCGIQSATFDECEAHEKGCAKNPSKAPVAVTPVAANSAPAAQNKAPQATGGGNGGGNLQEFLTGIGVRDVAKAAEALKGAGIETRSDFFNLDKDMRQELDEELKKGGVNLGDRGKIKKAENVAVSVKQGNGEVSVLNLQPGQAMQTVESLVRVFLGLGWADKSSSKTVDVDASCIGFSKGEPQETIFFGNLGNATKSLKHTGDILVGTAKGKAIADMERIYVWLPNVPANIDCLVFVANVYTSEADFSDLESAYIRMGNADTNQELARLSLSGAGMKGNGLVFAKVYRCGPKGPWHFHTLGMPLHLPGSSSVEEMIPQLKESGCAFSPPGAIADAPGKAAPAAPLDAAAKKKSQTPTGVYVAGALGVATVAGVAAATAIFMTTDLNADMFSPSIFENGVDFANLVPNGDAITGIGEGIADGAEGAFEWASGVTESVDFGAIGDGIGGAVGDAGGAISGVAGDIMGSDAMGAVGDGLGSAGEAIGGAAGDVMGSDAMGAVGDGLGSAGEAIGGAAGDVMGSDAMGAVAEGLGSAGGAIGGVAEGAGGAISSMAGSIDISSVVDTIGGLISSVAEIFTGD